MAEVASLTIAVVDISAKIGALCFQYLTSVKNARDDIQRLRDEASRLNACVRRLQSLLDGPDGPKFAGSRSLQDALTNCHSQFALLAAKLDPKKGTSLMRRFGARAWKWPFESKQVESIVGNLAKCRDNISLALQIDQAYVTRRI